MPRDPGISADALLEVWEKSGRQWARTARAVNAKYPEKVKELVGWLYREYPGR
jgi:hypothetical protein